MNMKSAAQSLALLIGSLAFMAILLELVLRMMPVNEGLSFAPVNQQSPVFHANGYQTISYSLGWDMFNAREIHINQAGFRNDQEYSNDTSTPTIGIIGDSYVEAVQVDYQDTFYGRLSEEFSDRLNVYSFGFSGAPLSQYLIWAKHAREEYGVDYLNFVIIANDFGESLAKYKKGPEFHHFSPCETEAPCLRRVDYAPGQVNFLARHSALVRYLINNMRIFSVPALARQKWSEWTQDQEQVDYVANVSATVSQERVTDSYRAIDAFLDALPEMTQLPPNRISMIMDGRDCSDDGAVFNASYFNLMRIYMAQEAQKRGYTVLDLRPAFRKDYDLHGSTFEALRDGHWNERGHQLVARTLSDFLKSQPLSQAGDAQ
ncbi:hypothetical protein [Aestuariispira insulae]|uniref:GDSL-like lipase/acylhydrolase family protein n=1 Tax=Aestuariispira insulae TaxID=1461337 RepID=A0A3D9HGM1_9PROT|nr:hypothetical protein [Aestuariispira insulae]RED48652.1 hypothetical protein DFP90_107157 [Aestuariispira insulae]